MTALDQARADMESAYIQLGRVLQSTLSPGTLQMEARNFTAAVDSFADTKRENSRGGA